MYIKPSMMKNLAKGRYTYLCIMVIFIISDAYGNNQIFDIPLEDLLNIKISTVSKKIEDISDAPGVISVITEDDINRFGGTTLRDILERVPGLISSGANYSNRTTIAPRGDQIKQNSSHVLILINGRPVREVQESGVSSDILESFPVNVIKRVEVIKGPGSVLYGTDAFSAVINIITREAENNGFSITGLSQPEDGFGILGDFSYKKGAFSAIVAGRFFSKNEWDTEFTGTVFDPVTGTTDLQTVAVETPDKGPGTYISLDFKDFKLMGSYNQWTTSSFSSPLLIDEVELRKNFVNAGYKYLLNTGCDFDFNVTYTRSRLNSNTVSERDSYNLVAEITNNFRLGDRTKFVTGGLYNRNDGEEKNLYPDLAANDIFIGDIISKGSLNSYAIYSQIEYKMFENLNLIGGFQANKVDNIELDFVPRIGIIYYPWEKINIKALYSEAFRAPSINELNIKFGDILVGNPDLKPEKVKTCDLSIGFQGDQLHFSANAFFSEMTDIIQTVFDANVNGIYQNNQEVNFWGLAFEGKFYVNKSIYLTASILYQQNKNDEDKDLSPISDIGMKAGVSYASQNGIIIGLSNIYQGDLNHKFKGDLNPHQGAYHLMHLHCDFNINKLFRLTLKQNISFVFNVDNVLDEEHYGYDLGGITADGIPSIPGRRIYIGMNFLFSSV